MAIQLQASARYLNKYEGAHDILSNSTPFFDENLWRKVAMGNDASNLDMYISALSKSDEWDYDKFLSDYMLDYGDDDTKLAALYNEAFGDRETMVDVEENGVKRTISQYEYYKENIARQNQFYKEQHEYELAAENDPNILADILSVGGEFLVGVDRGFAGTTSLLFSLSDVLHDYGNGRWDEGFAKWNQYWNAHYQPLTEQEFANGKSLYDYLHEFESEFTHLKDGNGELTTAGRFLTGAANTGGEMFAAYLIGGGLSKMGMSSANGATGYLASRTAGLVNTIMYYAPMAGRSMAETQAALLEAGASISTAELLAHTFMRTAAEISVEVVLDKIFGASGVDNWLFGRGTKAATKKSTWLRGLGRVGKDILQESSEEVLQEFSGLFIDNLFGHADKHFAELSTFSWQSIIDAAVIAALVSGAHAGISIASTSGLEVIGEDGSVHKMGKLAAYDYRMNLESFWESYVEAEQEFKKAFTLDSARYLPTSERLDELRSKQGELKYLLSQTKITLSKTIREYVEQDAESTEATRNTIDAFLSKGFAALSPEEKAVIEQKFKELPEYSKMLDLESELKSVSDELTNLESALSSEPINETANKRHNKKADKIREHYGEAFQQLYAAAKMLTAFSNQLGEERLKQANDLLTKVSESIAQGEHNLIEMERKFNELKATIQMLGLERPRSFWTELKESGATVFHGLFKRGEKRSKEEVVSADSKKVSEACEEILERCKKSKQIIVTEDGSHAVESEDGETISVPKSELDAGVDQVIHDLAERQLAKGLITGQFKGVTISNIVEQYEFFKGKKNVTQAEAAMALFYDTPFFTSLLWKADVDMYQFLSSLIRIESVVVADDVRSEIYKKKMREAVARMKKALIAYLQSQHNAEYRLDIFTAEERKKIEAGRWCKNLAQRVIRGEVLSKEDLNVLNKRINSLPTISSDDKKKLMEYLVSPNVSARIKCMDTLAAAYRDVFFGVYDGKTYMPLTSSSNKAFNYFLQEKGLTVATLSVLSDEERKVVIEQFGDDSQTSIDSFRADQFEAMTSNGFSYVREGDTIVTYSLDDETDKGYSYRPTAAVISGDDILDSSAGVKLSRKDRTFQVKAQNYNAEVRKLLDESVDPATSAYMTIDDVINNPNLLSKTIKDEIMKQYGQITDKTAFLYLRKYFINKRKNISISITSDGDYAFVDTAPMMSIFTVGWSDELKKIKDGINVWDLLADKYRIPYLEGVKIMVSPTVSSDTAAEFVSARTVKINDKGKILAYKGDIGYDTSPGVETVLDTPVILVSPGLLAESIDYIQFILTHEIQHAFQTANKMNMGAPSNIVDAIRRSGTSAKSAEAIVKRLAENVAKHRPKLFERDGKVISPTSAEGLKIVNEFVYFCSGESTAYGLDASKIVNFYPVLVNNDGVVTEVVMPWGDKFEIRNLSKTTTRAIQKDVEINREELLKLIEANGSLVATDDILGVSNGSFILSSDGKTWRMFNDSEDVMLQAAQSSNFMVIHSGDKNILFPDLERVTTASKKKVAQGEIYVLDFSFGATLMSIGTFKQLDELSKFIDLDSVVCMHDGQIVTHWYTKPTDIVDAVVQANFQPRGKVESLSFEDIVSLFHNLNSNDELNSLAPKVFEAFRKMIVRQQELGKKPFQIQTVGRYLLQDLPYGLDNAAGLFNPLMQEDLYGVSFSRRELYGQWGATVILHEMIHSVTSGTITFVKDRIAFEKGENFDDYLSIEPDSTWSKSEKGALVVLQIYQIVNKDGQYAFTNANEMIAELANPEFREYLKNQKAIPIARPGEKMSLWTRLKNAIFRILGMPVDNMLAATELALEKILIAPIQTSETGYYAKTDNSYAIPTNEIKDATKVTTPRKKSVKQTETQPEAVKAVFPHRRSKGRDKRTYVGVRKSKGTVLEPFAGQKLSESMVSFVTKSANAEYAGINEGIKQKIADGTLTRQDIMNWFFSVDSSNISESDEITFKLMNDSIFHNKFIHSLKELDEFIQVRTPNGWAMRTVMNEQGYKEQFAKLKDEDVYDLFMELIGRRPALAERFNALLSEYKVFEILDFKNLRRLWMQWFDGSVPSMGYIAGVAKAGAEIIATYGKGWGYSSGSAKGISLQSSAGKTKDGKATRTAEEVIASKQDQEDLLSAATEDHLQALLDAYRVKMVKEIAAEIEGMDISSPRVQAEIASRITEGVKDIAWDYDYDKPAFFEKYRKYVLNDSSSTAVSVQGLVDELAGVRDLETSDEFLERYETAKQRYGKMMRHKSLIKGNILSMNRTIKANLNRTQAKLFLKDYGEYFDENLDVKPELYRDVKQVGGGRTLTRLKDEATLLDLETIVREASKRVREGVYANEDFFRYRKKLDKKMDNYFRNLAAKSKSKSPVTQIKEKIVTVYVTEDEFHVDTEREVPKSIVKLLETTLTETAKTKVQLLSNDDERHYVMNLETFINQNIESISAWTQEDVNEIIDFYMNSEILPGTNRVKTWTTVQQLVLSHLIKMSNRPMSAYRLTDEQMNFAIERLKTMASEAGTMLKTWQDVLESFKAEKVFTQAALKVSGFELSPVTQGELEMAVASGDMARIKRAKERAYNEVVAAYRGRKTTLWSKLLRFERMALLSSPGTWVRNQTSNIILTGVNNLTDLMSRALPQSAKEKKLNQYRIVGTKVEKKYADFVQAQLFDSGFYKLLGDALTKSDTREHKRSNTDLVVELIKDKIETELFNKDSFPSAHSDKRIQAMLGKSAQFSQWFINFIMQDTWAIRGAFKKYVAKMLTEDQVDISSGLSEDVMKVVADAYVMAAHDFMHKPGFWSKVEHAMKTYLNNHLGASGGDAVYFMYKQLFPFAASAWNWFVDSLEFTPVGLVKGIVNLVNIEGTVSRIEEARRKGEQVRSSRFAGYMARRQLSRGMVGSTTLLLGIILALTGVAGIDDDDDEPKLIFGSGGNKPVYVSIKNLYGTSGILSGIAIGAGIDNDKKLFDVFAEVLTIMFEDSTFSDVFNSFRYSDSFGDYLLGLPSDMLGMFMPKFISSTMGAFKKYNVQYSKGITGMFQRFLVSTFPLTSYGMPYKVNPYTGDAEVISNNWFIANFFSRFTPLKVKQYNFGEVEQEAVLLGIRKGQLTGNYEIDGNKVTLSSRDTEKVNVFYGKLNKTMLEDLMNDKTAYTVEDEEGKRVTLKYSKMTEKQKKAVIERIMSNNSHYAKVYILTSSGEYKYYANDSEYQKLKELKIANVYRKFGKYEGFVKN